MLTMFGPKFMKIGSAWANSAEIGRSRRHEKHTTIAPGRICCQVLL